MSGRVPDVICVSANHWSGLPTSKQHLMQIVSRSARVLYVDPPLDVFSVLGQRGRWPKLRGLRPVDEQMWVLSPVVPAHPSTPAAKLDFHRGQAERVRKASVSLGLESPVLWTFAPEHVAYAGALDEALIVYHAADDPAATSGADREATSSIERDLMEAADLVFVVSQALFEGRAGSGKAHRLPNAADRSHFAAVLAGDPGVSPEEFAAAVSSGRGALAALEELEGPVIMFAGAAYGWFDEMTFLGIARARPDWNLVVVGPPGRALRAARLPGNVTLTGRRTYAEFPRFVVRCDVAVHPLREGAFATNCDPIVLYEYLLCGKPVVATPFPAALERGELLRTADTVDGFVAEIEESLLETDDLPVRAERIRFGLANTWEDRAERALGLIAGALDRRLGSGGARSEG